MPLGLGIHTPSLRGGPVVWLGRASRTSFMTESHITHGCGSFFSLDTTGGSANTIGPRLGCLQSP